MEILELMGKVSRCHVQMPLVKLQQGQLLSVPLLQRSAVLNHMIIVYTFCSIYSIVHTTSKLKLSKREEHAYLHPLPQTPSNSNKIFTLSAYQFQTAYLLYYPQLLGHSAHIFIQLRECLSIYFILCRKNSYINMTGSGMRVHQQGEAEGLGTS